MFGGFRVVAKAYIGGWELWPAMNSARVLKVGVVSWTGPVQPELMRVMTESGRSTISKPSRVVKSTVYSYQSNR